MPWFTGPTLRAMASEFDGDCEAFADHIYATYAPHIAAHIEASFALGQEVS